MPPETGSGAVESAHALVDSLAQLGVRDVVVCPGSRSAPLVYALDQVAKERSVRTHVRLDERAGAFTALGISRATPDHPAAVITTSGTATAHLLAAAMEAHHSGIGLILITADRPAELRGTHANQTTMQPGLFAPFARFESDLPAPEADHASIPHVRTVVTTAARAYAAATGPRRGPVHINLGFRDPLTPQALTPTPSATATDARAEFPLTQVTHAASAGVALSIAPRTLVVAGDDAGTIAPLIDRFDLPVVAEPSANVAGSVRIPPSALTAVMGPDADPEHPLRPTHVLVAGHSTLSRPVQRLLLGADGIHITVVSARPDWADAPRRASAVIDAVDVAGSTLENATATHDFASSWGEHVQRVRRERGTLDDAPWQARAAMAIWEASCADGVPLIVGASALIRDLEEWTERAPASPVVANRGLAGIDGTISMAGGYALAAGRRTRVLLGDVSALHDLTGFVVGPLETKPDLDIVVIDDGGGRIFGGLEHAAAEASLLERFFTTPHGTDIAAAGRALGISDVHETTARTLPQLLAAGQGTGRRLIVVREH